MDNNLKEVYFHCDQCVHEKLKENEHPCDICLTITAREDSHRPEFFKSKPVDEEGSKK